jgi:hypothetical protein
MIDYLKTYDCGIDPEKIKKNQFLNFDMSVNIDSGEIKTYVADYKGMVFNIPESGKVGLGGSLHKYYNDGMHNYDDFSYVMLVKTIQELQGRFDINPYDVYLRNLEFGVNLVLDICPRVFIDSLVTHKYTPFNITSNSKMLYASVEYSNYILKIYDKGLQYGLHKNILRIEIKVRRMSFISRTGIKTLADLTDKKKLLQLKEILLNTFQNILYWDKSSDVTSLNEKDHLLFTDGSNPKFWRAHLDRSGTNASKKMRKYKELMRKNGNNQFNRIGDMIKSKWDSLLTEDSPIVQVLAKSLDRKEDEKVRVLTESLDRKEDEKVRVLTKCENKDSMHLIQGGETGRTSFITSGIVGIVVQPGMQERSCLVTGLDISMQKETSRFISPIGVKFYYENHPEIFAQLKERLPNRWADVPLERQFSEIAHSIRNSYHSKRIHTQKAIKRLCGKPALFNNYELISQEKKNIANRS